jgi:prepilin-type processing-associated H-X9-DG protein
MNMKAKASLVLLVMWGMAVWANAAEPAAKPLPADAAVKEPAAITRTTVLPCPIPRPAFDHTKIDRTLKEPKYVSEKPAYRFFAFGPEGKCVMAMVLDESQGTGKGYDVYYLDLNFDRDVTGEAERFACKQPMQATQSDYKPPAAVVCDALNPDGTPSCMVGIPPSLMKELGMAAPAPPAPVLVVNPEPVDRAKLARKLDVPDPLFDYFVDWGGGKWELRSALKSGDWHTRSSMYGTGNVWSTDKVWAPVCRFGGMEWDFRQDGLKGKTLKPGDGLVIDTVKPFFAGSSPEVMHGDNRIYGGYIHARYSLESLERPGEANRVFFASNTCCGGTHSSRIIIPAEMPPGQAEVVLSMDTPDTYLGRVVQRIPVTIENPEYGKPIKELDLAGELRKQFPGDTVVELFQGADLRPWGPGQYDGARDLYIGGEGDAGAFVGAGTVGSVLSYSHDCRNDLHVGTVRNKRPLLRFDLSLLPRETKVKKAFLRLMAVEVKPKVDRTTQVRLIKKRWHEELCNAQTAFGDLKQEWHSSWYHGMRFPIGEEVMWEKPYATGDSDRVHYLVGNMNVLFGDGSVASKNNAWLSNNRMKTTSDGGTYVRRHN